MSARRAPVRPAPLDILRNGRPESEMIRGAGYAVPRGLARIACADGFDLSVQAGEFLYSTPRANAGPWTHVEVGFPSERPEPWDEWTKYVEDAERPTDTVYAYVPLAMVEAIIASHGGVA